MGWPRSITTWSHGRYQIEDNCCKLGIAFPAGASDHELAQLLERESRLKELCNQDYRKTVALGPSSGR